jgi:hypothetical protein
VRLDGTQLHLEPGQAVIPHGPDREFTVAEALPRGESQSIPSGFRNLGATTPLSDIFISLFAMRLRHRGLHCNK